MPVYQPLPTCPKCRRYFPLPDAVTKGLPICDGHLDIPPIDPHKYDPAIGKNAEPIAPGAMFDTEFEECVICISAPDALGNFEGQVPTGEISTYSVDMVTYRYNTEIGRGPDGPALSDLIAALPANMEWFHKWADSLTDADAQERARVWDVYVSYEELRDRLNELKSFCAPTGKSSGKL